MATYTAELQASLKRAASLLSNCDALLLCTGAGMGVASGLGTFRGAAAGIWPPLVERGIHFTSMSNPDVFEEDERFAWAFWQFRHRCYTEAEPHEGYSYLRDLCATKKFGGFSFTSNIDGHWLKVGMAEDRVYEVHGTLRFMQCQSRTCESGVWPTNDEEISVMTVDEETSRVSSDVPKCPTCSGTARPNVLMFGDWNYRHDREDVQSENYRQWRAEVEKGEGSLVVLEIGAGKAVPTVRHESRTVNRWTGAPVIRVNPEEPQADHLSDCVSIPLGCAEALAGIRQHMETIA